MAEAKPTQCSDDDGSCWRTTKPAEVLVLRLHLRLRTLTSPMTSLPTTSFPTQHSLIRRDSLQRPWLTSASECLGLPCASVLAPTHSCLSIPLKMVAHRASPTPCSDSFSTPGCSWIHLTAPARTHSTAQLPHHFGDARAPRRREGHTPCLVQFASGAAGDPRAPCSELERLAVGDCRCETPPSRRNASG